LVTSYAAGAAITIALATRIDPRIHSKKGCTKNSDQKRDNKSVARLIQAG